MKRFFFVLFFVWNCCSAQVNQTGDFQIWQHSWVDIDITKHYAIRATTEVRWGNHISELYFKYIQLQFYYRPYSWIEFGPGYRQTFTRLIRRDKKWEPVYNPLADLTFLIPIVEWRLIHRSRFQYLIFKDLKNRLLYRALFGVVFPGKIKTLYTSPYFTGEVFYLQGRQINQARFTSGFIANFSKYVELRTYYLLRYLKRNEKWKNQNVLGFSLFLFF